MTQRAAEGEWWEPGCGPCSMFAVKAGEGIDRGERSVLRKGPGDRFTLRVAARERYGSSPGWEAD